MKKRKICDFDCFNCKYSDCINDSTRSPYEESHHVVKDRTGMDARQEYAKRHYQENKEYYKAKALKRYYENREKILENKKEKYHADKG